MNKIRFHIWTSAAVIIAVILLGLNILVRLPISVNDDVNHKQSAEHDRKVEQMNRKLDLLLERTAPEEEKK